MQGSDSGEESSSGSSSGSEEETEQQQIKQETLSQVYLYMFVCLPCPFLYVSKQNLFFQFSRLVNYLIIIINDYALIFQARQAFNCTIHNTLLFVFDFEFRPDKIIVLS